jgi:hypothetical protein
VAWLTAFASKPAPTDFCLRRRLAVSPGSSDIAHAERCQ